MFSFFFSQFLIFSFSHFPIFSFCSIFAFSHFVPFCSVFVLFPQKILSGASHLTRIQPDAHTCSHLHIHTLSFVLTVKAYRPEHLTHQVYFPPDIFEHHTPFPTVSAQIIFIEPVGNCITDKLVFPLNL